MASSCARASPWLTQEFVYPHAEVEIDFFRVARWDGVPAGRDGQALAWQDPEAIDVAPLLPANTRVLAALRLPPIYAITCASELGEAAFPRVARRGRWNRGLRLLQLREKDWDPPQRAAFAAKLSALAAAKAASPAAERRRRGGAAPRLRRRALDLGTPRRSHARPRDMIVAASCHTRADVEHAAALDLDFVVLGPVRATPSHPQAAPLGWDAFARIAAGSRVPVYALGGLGPGDLETARSRGAHGVALRRAAWPPA